jgi:molybdenum cofactor guanylyltransferase
MTLSGIVLAGGRSSRFGASKLDADLDGRPVLDRTVDRLLPACDEVVVVGRPGRTPGVRFVEDPAPFEGPLAGLAEGLERSTGELAVVLGGDMPIVHAELLRAMVERLATNKIIDAIALVEGDVPRPLPLALRRAAGLAAARAALAAGERSLRGFLDLLRLERMAEPAWRAIDPAADWLLDIDAPADLEEALGRLRRDDAMRP